MSADEPPVRFDRDAAVASVFEACKATGASLGTCHVVAGWTADALDRIERERITDAE